MVYDPLPLIDINRMEKWVELVDELAERGWDFTWCRNSDLLDDGVSWVRFHRLGRYGTAEGRLPIGELIREAYDQAKGTE